MNGGSGASLADCRTPRNDRIDEVSDETKCPAVTFTRARERRCVRADRPAARRKPAGHAGSRLSGADRHVQDAATSSGAAGGGPGGGGARPGGAPPAAGAAPAAFPPPPAEYTVTAIPGVIAAGQKWTKVWETDGNNADGILADKNGDLLIAQNHNSAVVKLDRSGKVVAGFPDTHTGGALSMNKKGDSSWSSADCGRT